MEMTIQREISHILQFELKNPNLGFCTVTDVQCTSDLSQAKVYVTFLGKQGRNDAGMRVLNQSKGFIRSGVAKKIKIRKMPELIFIQDTSLEQGNKIENILKEIEKQRRLSGLLFFLFVDSIKQQSPNGRYVKFFVKKYTNIKDIPAKINNI